jgi:hypothetical protein
VRTSFFLEVANLMKVRVRPSCAMTSEEANGDA